MGRDWIKLAGVQLVVAGLPMCQQTIAMGQPSILEQQRAIAALGKAGAEVSKYTDEPGTAGLSVVFPDISPLFVPPGPAGNRSAEARIDYSAMRYLKSVPTSGAWRSAFSSRMALP